MAGKKEQIVALVDGGLKDRIDALRICVGDSRARLLESLLNPSVGKMENTRAPELNRVNALADRAGVTWQEYARAYALAYQRTPYGASLDDLEQDDTAVRAVLPAIRG